MLIGHTKRYGGVGGKRTIMLYISWTCLRFTLIERRKVLLAGFGKSRKALLTNEDNGLMDVDQIVSLESDVYEVLIG